MKTDAEGNITEATKPELYEYWLKAELFELYDFNYFLWLCKHKGVKVVTRKRGKV